MCPRIYVEDKYTYNITRQTIKTNRVNNAGLIYNGVVASKLPTYPTVGSEEDNRVGRKIQTSSLVIENYYSLEMDYTVVGFDQSTFAGALTTAKSNVIKQILTSLNTPSDNYGMLFEFANSEVQRNLKFEPVLRHFIVEFDREAIDVSSQTNMDTQLGQWFLETFTYSSSGTESNSIQQRTLKESSNWTGRFRILHDSLLKFSLNDPIKHEVISLKYNRAMNFDAPESPLPSGRLVIEFWIGPISTQLDYGSRGIGYLMSQSFGAEAQYSLFIIDGSMKMKYTDM